MDKYKKALEKVIMNLRCIDTTENKQVDSYIDDSIKTIKDVLDEDKLPKLIPHEVKNKVYEVTQDVFEQYGNVETEKVRADLEEDHGICFFNTIELEKLIREGLDKQIFAYR